MTAAPPPWAQPGVTDVAVARRFLADLGAADLVALTTNDGDAWRPLTSASERIRGHGVTIAANLFASTRPDPDLLAYHHALGLGPRRHLCPRVTSPDRTLAELARADATLVQSLRSDPALARVFVSFKTPGAARLIAALGLAPVWCAPPPAAYDAANDKLALARAGGRYGFDTLPVAPVTDETELAAGYRALAASYGAGCIVRATRGTSGLDVYRARTLGAARRRWRRLVRAGRAVMLVPYVPPVRVRRNVAVHGVVTADGYAPFAFTDQILRGHHYRGGDATAPWTPAEVAAVRAGLDGVARWLGDIGYVDAPLGVDGFLIGEAAPRFLVLDPNARLSATTMPWAAFATLAAAANRPFVWRFEGFRLLGRGLDFERIRRRLGADLLDPDALDRGGVLPTSLLLLQPRVPLASMYLWVLFVGRDGAHVARLRRRVRRLALIAR